MIKYFPNSFFNGIKLFILEFKWNGQQHSFKLEGSNEFVLLLQINTVAESYHNWQ